MLQLFDLRALAADDDAGARSADGDAQLVARAIDFNRAHAGRLQLLAQAFLQLQIFLQQLGVALLGEPARAPRLVEAQPESVRMNFLTHLCPLSPPLSPRCATCAADTGKRGPSAPGAPASCAALRSRRLRDTYQLVHVHIFVLVLRIGDGRLQHLLHRRRDALVDRAQRDDARRSACWPRIRSTTSRAFCGETRIYLASALASMTILLCRLRRLLRSPPSPSGP